MARMRRITQRVDDPQIEAFERMKALGRNVVEVRRISSIADAVAERRDITVLENKRGQGDGTALPLDGLRFARFDRALLEDRRIVAAGRLLEAVSETRKDVLARRLVEIDRNPSALMQNDGAKTWDQTLYVCEVKGLISVAEATSERSYFD